MVSIEGFIYVKKTGEFRGSKRHMVGYGHDATNPKEGEVRIPVTLNLPDDVFEDRLELIIDVPEISSDKEKTENKLKYNVKDAGKWE